MKGESILVLAMVFLVANGSALADLSDGLVAYYPFSGNANDASGNGHDGTVYGAMLTTDRLGNPNSAFNFDGTDDYVSIPYAAAFQLPVFTFAAWVRPTVDLSSSLGSHIVSRGEDSITDHSAFTLAVIGEDVTLGKGAYVNYEDNGDDGYVFSTWYYPQADAWTHLAATRLSNGQLNIYVNGNLLCHWHSTPAPTTECFQDLLIGTYCYCPDTGYPYLTNFFPGAIDEVRIYNRALSADEIEELASDPVPSLSGWVWMESGGGIGYSLDEDDLIYFYSSGPVWYYNITTGQWFEPGPGGPGGWVYFDWPFFYVLDADTYIFVLPPESGLRVYHFRTGQWTVSPRIIP